MLKTIFPFLLTLNVSYAAQAVPIASFLGGTSSPGMSFFGQSFTVTTPGLSDHISFSFFSDNPPTTPSAAGVGYLLDQVYTGTPNNLASAVGILGTAVASGGVWTFAPGLALTGGVQYFFYTDTAVTASGSNSNAYAGGTAFDAAGAASNYIAFGGDANFLVDGTAVAGAPEIDPAGAGLAGLICLGLVAVLQSQRLRRLA